MTQYLILFSISLSIQENPSIFLVYRALVNLVSEKHNFSSWLRRELATLVRDNEVSNPLTSLKRNFRTTGTWVLVLADGRKFEQRLVDCGGVLVIKMIVFYSQQLDFESCSNQSLGSFKQAVFDAWSCSRLFQCGKLTNFQSPQKFKCLPQLCIQEMQIKLNQIIPTGFVAGNTFLTSRQMTDIDEQISGPASFSVTYGMSFMFST